jgi:PBP1b-binding outer membrane lipoprotein LpoB
MKHPTQRQRRAAVYRIHWLILIVVTFAGCSRPSYSECDARLAAELATLDKMRNDLFKPEADGDFPPIRSDYPSEDIAALRWQERIVNDALNARDGAARREGR